MAGTLIDVVMKDALFLGELDQMRQSGATEDEFLLPPVAPEKKSLWRRFAAHLPFFGRN